MILFECPRDPSHQLSKSGRDAVGNENIALSEVLDDDEERPEFSVLEVFLLIVCFLSHPSLLSLCLYLGRELSLP